MNNPYSADGDLLCPGDRVLFEPVGEYGKIIVIDYEHELDNTLWVGVRFDRKIPNGHDLDRRCENGYGYWVRADDLILPGPWNTRPDIDDDTFLSILSMEVAANES